MTPFYLEKCGKCIDRCIFDANVETDGRGVVNAKKCMGCGLCVSTCPIQARIIAVRDDYEHDHQVPAEILLGQSRA